VSTHGKFNSGLWQCEACGAWLDSSDAVPGSWHWTGTAWEHGGHANMPPQAGHFPARFFATIADAIAHATASVTAERDAALAAVDAVRADYAPRREPPTADEVRAVSRLWGASNAPALLQIPRGLVTANVSAGARGGIVGWTEPDVRRVAAAESWLLLGPTGPVAWSELARLVEGVRRG